MAQLKFIETYTVEGFKKRVGAYKVKAGASRRNPGKYFFVYYNDEGEHVERCSSRGLPENPMISLVESEDGEQFWLAHADSTLVEW